MRALALVALGFLGACSAPTELLLVVQGNLTAPTLGAVRIGVTDSVDAGGVDGFSVAPTCVCVDPTACTGSVPQATMPLTIPLDPGHQGTTPFEIQVSGFSSPDCTDPTDNDLIDETAVVHFVSHERLGVYVSLDSECVGVECDDGETCKAGACVSNNTPPMVVTDMTATPPITVSDMAAPSGDMATQPSFTLLQIAPNVWNVALGGGMAALGYAEKDSTSFFYGILQGTVAPQGPPATLPGPAMGVCAVYDDRSAGFVFGVATATTVTMFSTNGSVVGGPAAGVPVYTATSGTLSELQCARSADGVVFAWLELPVSVGGAGGTGTNGSPAHGPSNTSMIELVDIVTGAMGPTPSQPVQVASAASFQLASTGFTAAGTTVPVAVMFVPGGTYTDSCNNSVLNTYSTTSFSAPNVVTTCVPLDPLKGPDVVSIAGSHSAVAGVKPNSGKGTNPVQTSFGGASGPQQSVAMAVPAQLAMAPVASESFAIAFTAQGTTDLVLETATLVHPLTSVAVSKTVNVKSPVELASDDAGRTFLTWVDDSDGALHGLITP